MDSKNKKIQKIFIGHAVIMERVDKQIIGDCKFMFLFKNHLFLKEATHFSLFLKFKRIKIP